MNMPKAYENIENGIAVEKFVLFPDMTDGRFDKFVNRNLFFGHGDKINLRLPTFLWGFQSRQVSTLDHILKKLKSLD